MREQEQRIKEIDRKCDLIHPAASYVSVKHGDGTSQWFVQPDIRWLLDELKRITAEMDRVKELESQVPTETNVNA